jgi:hypothetical protein
MSSPSPTSLSGLYRRAKHLQDSEESDYRDGMRAVNEIHDLCTAKQKELAALLQSIESREILPEFQPQRYEEMAAILSRLQCMAESETSLAADVRRRYREKLEEWERIERERLEAVQARESQNQTKVAEFVYLNVSPERRGSPPRGF